VVTGAALCRFPEGKLDVAKQNRPVWEVIVLPLNPFKKSVYKTFKKSFIKNASQSVGQGWDVVEDYISGQKGYEKTDTVPVIAEEKAKTHKTWYTSLYNKLFGGKYQNQ
jgi:hypothetical protein